MPRFLFLVATLVLLLGAMDPARAQGRTQILVVDVSFSMTYVNTPELPGADRMTSARAAIARILRDLGARLPASTPDQLGLATFGGVPDRCDSYGVRVSPRRFDQGLAAQINAEIARIRPLGRTPIVEGIVSAAEALPPHGGRLVVITDLDERGECRPPCEAIDRLRQISKPHPNVVEVLFLVTVGVQSRSASVIREFSECLGPGTKLRHITSLTEAEEIGAEIALALAQPAAAPVGARVNLSFGQVPFVPDLQALGFQASAEWNTRGLSAARLQPPNQVVVAADVVDSHERLTISLRLPNSPRSSCPGHAHDPSLRRVTILEERADVLRARGDVPYEYVLPPSVLCLYPPGDGLTEWTIQDLAGGVQAPALNGAQVALPPGRYRVSVRAGNRAVDPQEVTLGYGSSMMLQSREAPRAPAMGSLLVRAWSFGHDRAEAEPNDARLRLPSSQNVSRSGTRLQVTAGEAEVALRPRGAQDETIARVRVASDRATEVHTYTAPSRLLLTLTGLLGSDAQHAQWWVGEQTGPAHCRGPVCDLALPPGKHNIIMVIEGRPACRLEQSGYQLEPRSVLAAMARVRRQDECHGIAPP